MEMLFGRGGRRLLKLDKKREMLCGIVIKIHYLEEFLYFNGLDLKGEVLAPFFLLIAGGSAEGAARGRLHCSRIGIRITGIRAGTRGWGRGERPAPPPAAPGGRCPGGDSLRELLLVRERRCHRRAERRRTARPRGSRPENGAPPGNPRPFPPSPRPAPLRAAAAAAPGPTLQNGGRSLFAATAASIRPAGRRDRPAACPPALRGEDSSPVLRGRARQGSPR